MSVNIAEAFREHADKIYTFVYFKVGQNKEVAEDITQNTFVKALRNKDNFDEEKASLKSWLYVIARNLVIDYYRSSKRTTIADTEIVDLNTETSLTIDSEIMYDYVVTKISQMKKSEAELLTLRYINQMDIKEISEILDKSYDSVKVSVHRALKKLKQIINDENK